MEKRANIAPSIGVCLGPRCADYGGRDLLESLRLQNINATELNCQSLCQASPVVRLPDRCLLHANLDEVLQETSLVEV